MAVAIVDGPGTAPLGRFSAMCTPVQWSWEGSAGVQVPDVQVADAEMMRKCRDECRRCAQ